MIVTPSIINCLSAKPALPKSLIFTMDRWRSGHSAGQALPASPRRSRQAEPFSAAAVAAAAAARRRARIVDRSAGAVGDHYARQGESN